jgi:hypothetical protein
VGALVLAIGASSVVGLAMAPQAGAGSTGATQTYVVLYKSGASNGISTADVAAPGGDRRFQVTC